MLPGERVTRRRASSSPPATLRHFERAASIQQARSVVMHTRCGVPNPRISSALLRSLVLSMAYTELDSAAVRSNTVGNGKCTVEVAEVSLTPVPEMLPTRNEVSHPSPSSDALRSELDSAKTQIELLNKVNEQMLREYSALEAKFCSLEGEYARVATENETLKQKLTRCEEEIDEQFHLICQLRQDTPTQP